MQASQYETVSLPSTWKLGNDSLAPSALVLRPGHKLLSSHSVF